MKKLFSILILCVFSIIIAHDIIPHDHCYDESNFICVHDDDNNYHSHENHSPHHDESHFIDFFIKNSNPIFYISNIVLFCLTIDNFSFDLDEKTEVFESYYYIPQKIPELFFDSFSLRAPPLF